MISALFFIEVGFAVSELIVYRFLGFDLSLLLIAPTHVICFVERFLQDSVDHVKRVLQVIHECLVELIPIAVSQKIMVAVIGNGQVEYFLKLLSEHTMITALELHTYGIDVINIIVFNEEIADLIDR